MDEKREKSEFMSRLNIEAIVDENSCLKRENLLKNRLIDILEDIKDKLEMKVFLLSSDCGCDAIELDDNDSQLAHLYEQYMRAVRVNTSGGQDSHLPIEPIVILDVDSDCDDRCFADFGQRFHQNNGHSMAVESSRAMSGQTIRNNNKCDNNNNKPLNIDSLYDLSFTESSKSSKKSRNGSKTCARTLNVDTRQTTPFVCDWDKCGKSFKNADNLSKHKRIHFKDKRFKCDWPKCDYECVHSYSLTFHKRLHTGEKPYVCDWPECDYRCAHSYSMVFHKRKHTGEKKYFCAFPECGYSARMLTDFKRHQLRHTGRNSKTLNNGSGELVPKIKGFKCDFVGCDKWCKSLGYMKTHIRKKHQIGD